MAKVIDGVDGWKALVGQPLGASDWNTMTLADIQRFADATGDHQWIHLDEARCRAESPYGAPIAHGYFSLALVAGLYKTVVDVRGFKATINYGADKVRFPNPLKVGQRYRLALALAEVRDVKGGIETVMNATIEIDGEPKPACAATILYRFLT